MPGPGNIYMNLRRNEASNNAVDKKRRYSGRNGVIRKKNAKVCRDCALPNQNAPLLLEVPTRIEGITFGADVELLEGCPDFPYPFFFNILL